MTAVDIGAAPVRERARPVARVLTVGIADYAVASGAVHLVTNGLGSCVAVALYAREVPVGALAHILLPNVNLSTTQNAPGKYPTTAIPAMLRRMRELGAPAAIDARIVGGASMFQPLLAPGAMSLGARNVAAVHAVCAEHGIRIVAQDIGGAHGRSVVFDVATGRVTVRSVQHGDRVLDAR